MGVSVRVGMMSLIGVALLGCGSPASVLSAQEKRDAKDSAALVGVWKSSDLGDIYNFPHYVFLENGTGMLLYDAASLFRFKWKLLGGNLKVEFPSKQVGASETIPVKFVSGGTKLKVSMPQSFLFYHNSVIQKVKEYVNPEDIKEKWGSNHCG